MELNAPAFALACALIWSFGLLFLTWWIIAFAGSSSEATLIGRIYRGETLTPAGSVMGLGLGAG